MTIIERLKSLKHKDGVNPDDWTRVNAKLLILADYTVDYCKEHNLPLVFTSIIRPKIPGISTTDIHSTGRAFDISVRGWKLADILAYRDHVNDKFTLGAISARDGKEREVVYEDGISAGKGAHLHIQCRN
jgi:hypothetical protein